MKRILLALGFVALFANAQTPTQNIYYYSGSNLIYSCTALAIQPSSAITVSAVSNASPASFTATAHGLDFPGAATTSPVVSISGGTGAWAAINGSWVATIITANAFTIPVDSTSFGALTVTLVVTTQAPKGTAPVWQVKNYVYSGSNLIFSGTGFAPAGVGSGGSGGPSSVMNQICANRTALSYQ